MYYVKSPVYKRLYLDCNLFVSDLPKSYFQMGEVTATTAMDMLKVMMALQTLQFVCITNVIWLFRELVATFLRHSVAVTRGCVEYMALRRSGMARDLPWAIRGRPQDISVALENRCTDTDL